MSAPELKDPLLAQLWRDAENIGMAGNTRLCLYLKDFVRELDAARKVVAAYRLDAKNYHALPHPDEQDEEFATCFDRTALAIGEYDALTKKEPLSENG